MSFLIQYSSNLIATKILCTAKYMQKSQVQSLELLSSHQFRKELHPDTESLNLMFEGYELLKVKLCTEK